MHLPEGAVLQNGRYKIIHFLNSGGFGCTYEGEQTLMGAKVAIKEFFVKDFCNREDDYTVSVGTKSKTQDFLKLKQSFIKEASVLFKMQHPNIVRVTEVFEENGTAYYVMDFIEGASLDKIVEKKGKLPEQEALNYIRQVCEALKYVHSQNRLHLDIKPGNIMVDNTGKATLIDFGTSKYYDEQTGEQTSMLSGVLTKAYAPLELIEGSFDKFNPAADIYSLGATLYKLLTGITPASAYDLMRGKKVLQPLPSIISESTRKALQSAMQISNEKRPRSIDEFERILYQKQTNADEESTTFESHEVPKTEADSPKIADYEAKLLKNEKKNEPVAKVEKSSSVNDSLNKSEISEKPIVEKEQTKSSRTKIYIGVAAAIAIFLICFFFKGYNTVELSTPDGNINGYEYVDLGLPSGLKWATCNVGALKPEEYGEYFAWGETKTKQSYTGKNNETCEKGTNWLESNGYIGSEGDLTLSHDAASQNWRGSWRMPTEEEIRELMDNTTTEWRTLNGVKGRLVKSKKNGKTIFFPAAGYRFDSSLNLAGEDGRYWSSTPYEGYSNYAYRLLFYSGDFCSHWDSRDYGFPVRPVSE